MCGRLVHTITPEGYATYLDLSVSGDDLEPTYNAAPTHRLPVVRLRDGEKELVRLRWGFDSWQGSKVLINARAETVAEKASFREAWHERRGLLLCTGWYEWQGKQPYFVSRKDGKPVVMAVLWQSDAFTIMTCAAGNDLAWLHDRVPVVLERRNWEGWLRGDPAEAWMYPFPAGSLMAIRVSPKVGSVRNNYLALLTPIG